MTPNDSNNTAKVSTSDIGDSLAIGVVFALILTVVQRGIGFVRGIALCRVLPDEEVGLWSLAFSFLMLLGPLAVMGLPGTFGRFVEHYRLKGQLRTFLTRITIVCGITTILLSAGLCFGANFLSETLFGSPNHSELVIGLGVSLLGIVLVNFVTSILEALRQIRLVTLIRFLTGVLFSLVSLVAVVAVAPTAVVVTYSFGITCLIGLAPAVWYFRHIKKNPVESTCSLESPSIWKQIAPFAAWMWFVNFAANCFELSDRYMLLQLMPGSSSIGQAMVGQYHSSRVVPLLFVSVATMLAGVLMPYLTAAWENGQKTGIKKQLNLTLKLTSFGFTTCGAIVLMFAPFLFNVILLGRYNEGMSVLPFTLVYCLWYSLFIVSENHLWLKHKGKLAFAAIFAGLLTNVGFNLWMIPIWGLHGAVYATGISNVVCLGVLSVFNHQCGWKVTFPTVFAMVLPAILIAPVSVIVMFMAVLLFAAWKTDILVGQSERDQLGELLEKIKTKFGWRTSVQRSEAISSPS